MEDREIISPGLGRYADFHQHLVDAVRVPDELAGIVKPYFNPEWNGFFWQTEDRIVRGPYHSVQAACIDLQGYIASRQQEDEQKRLEEAATNRYLRPRVVELFDLMQEECGEVIQARSKLRRGNDDRQFRAPRNRPDGPTNITLMETEIYDFMTLAFIADKWGVISEGGFFDHLPGKLERLAKYTDIFSQHGDPDWEERLEMEKDGTPYDYVSGREAIAALLAELD